MITYIVNEKRQAGGNSYKEYTWHEVLKYFNAPRDLADIDDLKEWYERENQIPFNYDIEVWRNSVSYKARELTLREFINTLLEKATEEQLDMPLLCIGAGNDGNWYIMTSNCEHGIYCREEIVIPIYKEEK